MKKEELWTDSTQFNETKFGVTSKALDPVDVIFAARKFLLVMMDAPVFVDAVQEPAVSKDGGFGKHLSLDNRERR